MSRPQSLRRRIVTGLNGYLDEPALQRALQHWDEHFAGSARTSLQQFVFEIAQDSELRQQRSSMLLSLMEAMKLPEASLSPDTQATPPTQPPDHPEHTASAAAFAVLITTLMGRLNKRAQHSLRLDLLASLDHRQLPEHLIEAMHRWLNEGQPLRLLPTSPGVLRALVNRTYVVLCERQGPVPTDSLLAEAVEEAQRLRPRLRRRITELL